MHKQVRAAVIMRRSAAPGENVHQAHTVAVHDKAKSLFCRIAHNQMNVILCAYQVPSVSHNPGCGLSASRRAFKPI
jgi:hypothetical protein